jgi:hypothetical protein
MKGKKVGKAGREPPWALFFPKPVARFFKKNITNSSMNNKRLSDSGARPCGLECEKCVGERR